MELEFKPDFAEAQKQWRALWQGTNTRPLVCLVLPKEGTEPIARPPYTAGADGNFEPVIEQSLAWAATHDFLGGAIPFHHLEFGPDHFSALLGADLKFTAHSPGTSWCQPFVEDWDRTKIAFRRNTFWWKRTVDFIRALRKRCDGKMLVAAPTLCANLDALAAVRGVSNLLMDMVVCPDKIHRALNAVCHAYAEIMGALSEELDFEVFGSISRHGLYCEGKIDVLQCDTSCMIGPGMFQEFVVPCLERQCAILDAAEYHLDGPGAVKHLEAVCRIIGIDIIQWVAGAGSPPGNDWSDIYGKIDELGKGQIRTGSPGLIRRLWRECKSRKLVFDNTAIASKKEAERFLAELGTI